MTKFTIYTEQKNTSLVHRLAHMHLGDFTLIEAKGNWGSVRENTIIIEHFIEETNNKTLSRACIRRLVRDINAVNSQTCCLVIEQQMKGAFV